MDGYWAVWWAEPCPSKLFKALEPVIKSESSIDVIKDLAVGWLLWIIWWPTVITKILRSGRGRQKR